MLFSATWDPELASVQAALFSAPSRLHFAVLMQIFSEAKVFFWGQIR